MGVNFKADSLKIVLFKFIISILISAFICGVAFILFTNMIISLNAIIPANYSEKLAIDSRE